jgi:hypothetical protein
LPEGAEIRWIMMEVQWWKKFTWQIANNPYTIIIHHIYKGPPMTKKRFHTNCICANGNSINEMKDNARNITYRTFLSHVDTENFKEIEKNLGYDRYLRLKNDWHVSFHKSKYRSKPCVYFSWSGIEYIFI